MNPEFFRTIKSRFLPLFIDSFVPDGLNPSGMVKTIDGTRATVPSPTLLKWLCLIICFAYFLVVTLLLVSFLLTRRRFWKTAKQGKAVQDPLSWILSGIGADDYISAGQ
jgi:hypothetical protein